ncbi:hypothetical protein BGZ49_001179 [Haplosporangium sp. Z 27]|nr:hypothetical protein BGZ49_001179 [Haplosporangium sp. Z 27]
MNKYSFDIELDTVQPFVVDLDLSGNSTQTISGAIVLKLAKPESFRVAEIAIHGHVGLVLNSDTEDPAVVHETLIENTTDLIAANDTEGDGVLHFDEGTQYIPFRIDLIRPNNLAPSLINRLDTEFIDWKYEIHATLRRNSFFSVTRVVKHDLILRRLIEPTTTTTSIENELVSAIDLEGEYRSKLTCPSGRIVLGQDRLQVQLELEARSKEFAIKEVDCAVVQTEEVDYLTKDAHPSVKNA